MPTLLPRCSRSILRSGDLNGPLRVGLTDGDVARVGEGGALRRPGAHRPNIDADKPGRGALSRGEVHDTCVERASAGSLAIRPPAGRKRSATVFTKTGCDVTNASKHARNTLGCVSNPGNVVKVVVVAAREAAATRCSSNQPLEVEERRRDGDCATSSCRQSRHLPLPSTSSSQIHKAS